MTPTIEYKKTIQERGGHKLLLPGVTRFGELFSRWRTYTVDTPKGMGPWPMAAVCGGRGGAMIGSYCNMHRTKLDESLRVAPSEELLQLLRSVMLPVEYDEIHFSCTDRSDGVLVCAKYNSIIGSRWLALLGPDMYEEISQGLEA